MNPITRVFEDTEIRIIQKDGDPWFVAKDVCEALNLGQTTNTIRRLDDDEKGVNTIKAQSGAAKGHLREVNIINEAGIYRLIFTSRNDEAERFKRWLAHDVLPSIRKTGRYDAKEAGRAEPQGESPFAALAEQSRLYVTWPSIAATQRTPSHKAQVLAGAESQKRNSCRLAH